MARNGIKECVVDTNVLVYDTIEDSEHHETASAIIDNLDICIIPSVVLEEFIFTLAKLGLDNKIIYEKVLDLLETFEYLPIEKEDIINALNMIEKEKVSFKKFNDKLILCIAERRKAKLLTFDKELQKEQKRYKVSSPLFELK
ncbi:MAG: PIN domain-containing protein [Thermoproteota archaeon]|jgi:Predicted nucleic acid-binding protein, contains PIN domain